MITQWTFPQPLILTHTRLALTDPRGDAVEILGFFPGGTE
jgi:hypothetical protein